jgi:hypothetical protein
MEATKKGTIQPFSAVRLSSNGSARCKPAMRGSLMAGFF